MKEREFDRFSATYDELLEDPIRDRFSAGESAFFHERKRDLIRRYLQRAQLPASTMSYLDLGCGKGELLSMLRNDFGRVTGCDPSQAMLSSIQDIPTRVQEQPNELPFESEEFDFVTAVCVFHHVPLAARVGLVQEVSRILKPGGTFAIIEHNPKNPVTRLIVSRTPVDADAILLEAHDAGGLMKVAGFMPQPPIYFLYFPGPIYRRGGRHVESLLSSIPLGGQYAIFGTKNGRSSL